MIKRDNKRLSYKPDLKYTDEYTSNGDDLFNNEYDAMPLPEEEGGGIIEDLIEGMDNLEGLIDKFPGDVSDIIGEIYDQILDFVHNELEDKELDKIPEEEDWTYIVPEPEMPDIDIDDTNKPKPEENFDEDDFWTTEDDIPIHKEDHTQKEIIEKEYIKNLVDLFDDYFINFQTTISNFWTGLIFAGANKSSDEIKMITDNILLNSSDVIDSAKHLLDTAVRVQISKNVKLSYFSNMFNAEETIKHLKQFKAMYELRLRYAEIEEQDGSTKTNQMNNNILKAAKMQYNKKYDIAYENLYRYLKSSNTVLNDSLQTWMQEIKSKQILIERNGIK